MEKEMRSRYINPLTDFGFARLFFSDLSKVLLIDFLNCILPEENTIVNVQYKPTIQPGYMEEDRKAIFDIFCTTDKGEFLIVEMQRAKQAYFKDRSLYYATFPIQNQAPKGKWNFQLKAVYFIGILDFILFDETNDDQEHYINYVRLIRERTGTVFSKKINFVFIELPKFLKTESELSTNTDRWLFCLRNLSRLQDRPEAVQGRIFEHLFRMAEIKKLTDKEMEAYRKSVLEYQDVRDAVDFAREEGVEEGMKKGLQKGIDKGREEGEQRAKQLIALNCLKMGMPISGISSLTGLSEEDILKLKNEE